MRKLCVRVVVALFFLSTPVFAQTVVVGSGSREELGPGAQVDLNPAGMDIQSGGILIVGGTSPAAQGIVTSGVTAGVPINVLLGGTVDLKFARLESVTVAVASGAQILRFHDTVFIDLNPGTTPWVDLSLLVAGDRVNLPFSFNRVSFSGVAGTTRANIKSGVGTPILRMLGNPTAHGNRWGQACEADSANVVHWHTDAVVRTGPNSGTFDTIEDALKAPGTFATSTLTVTLGQAMIDDVVDFNTVSNGASSTGPTVVNACLAPMVGKAVLDGDGNTDRRGKLVNCIVARGTVEETTAENCTFFDPSAAAITVDNVAGTNCLIESGFGGSGNSFVTSITSADSALFAGSAAYNFHLVRPGGDAAIDTGTPLTITLDMEGEPRGFDGKPPVGGAWDIGADEFAPPLISNLTSSTANGVYGAGGSINVTVNFSEAVTLAGGNLRILLDTGGVVTILPFGPASTASGTYFVATGHNTGDLTGVSPLELTAGASLKDAVGNDAVLTIPSGQNLADSKDLLIDTTATTIANVSSTTNNGTYGVGAQINVTVTFSEPVILTGGSLRITLNTGALVELSPFGPAATASVIYTVANGHNTSDLNAFSPLTLAPGALLRDMAGNHAGLTIPSGLNIADQKAIVINTGPSTIPLPPTNVRTISYGNAIDVEWDPSPSTGIAGYCVYRKLSTDPSWPGSPLNAAGVVLNTKYRDTFNLQSGVTYVYRVVAVKP